MVASPCLNECRLLTSQPREDARAISPHVGVACGQMRGTSRAPSSTVHEESAMTTPHHAPKPGTREHFLQVSQLQRWGTIQEYVDLCRTYGYFTPEFYATA